MELQEVLSVCCFCSAPLRTNNDACVSIQPSFPSIATTPRMLPQTYDPLTQMQGKVSSQHSHRSDDLEFLAQFAKSCEESEQESVTLYRFTILLCSTFGEVQLNRR